MAKFDVHRRPGSDNLLLECQANLLDRLPTRFVIPLLPANADIPTVPRLNPVFQFAGQPYVMATQLALSVENGQLGSQIGSLAEHDLTISNAIDFLLGGV